MYNHGISNYISRQISNAQNNILDWVNSKQTHNGSNNLIHSALEFYTDLISHDNLSLAYLEGSKEEGHYKGMAYGEMYRGDIEALNANAFISSYKSANNNTAYFTTPTFSDATNKALLNLPVYDLESITDQTIYDKLYNIAVAELQRVMVVKANNEVNVQNEGVEGYVKRSTGFNNLDLNGDRLHFLSFLNDECKVFFC